VTLVVRAETLADHDAIRAVHESAFPTPQEADLVDSLRVDDDLVLSLVALEDDAIVGHVAFSRMTVNSDAGDFPALALAPVGVIPEFQGEGVGTALIGNGLQLLAKKGEALVFVLGEPDYYGRFGFSAELAAGFISPFPGPYFQLRRLAGDVPVSGSVHYAYAFSELS
jgi:putative acetyltransferase